MTLNDFLFAVAAVVFGNLLYALVLRAFTPKPEADGDGDE